MNCWYLWDARCTISLTRWRWSRGRSGGCLWSMPRSSPPALHSRLKYLWPHHSRTSLPLSCLPRSRAHNRLGGSHIAGNAKIIESPTMNIHTKNLETRSEWYFGVDGARSWHLVQALDSTQHEAALHLSVLCHHITLSMKYPQCQQYSLILTIQLFMYSTFSRIIFSLWPRAAMSDLGQNWPWANNAIISGQYKFFSSKRIE